MSFVETEARAARALYILGDLFEVWVGDDEDDPRLAPVQAALAGLTRAGVPCSLMHGNRDFLLGPRFCAATGAAARRRRPCRLLRQRGLLTHGDLLCIDDTRYMSLRGRCAIPQWQRDFLAKPLAERRKIAAALRQPQRRRDRGEVLRHYGRESDDGGERHARARRRRCFCTVTRTAPRSIDSCSTAGPLSGLCSVRGTSTRASCAGTSASSR